MSGRPVNEHAAGPANGVRQIVIIHTGGLGDLLQTVPALATLRQLHAAARVTLLGIPRRGRLLEAAGLVDDLRDIEGSGLHRLLAPEVATVVAASAPDLPGVLRGAQLVIDFLTGPKLSETLPRLTGARVVPLNSFPQYGTAFHHADRHILDQLIRALELSPAECAADEVRLSLPQEALRAALEASGLLERLPASGGRLVIMHPGSGSRLKNWSLSRFMELAEWLQTRNCCVRWLLGPAELERDEFADLLRDDGPRCLVADDLLAVAAVLHRAAAYVGNDSGVTHLAAALGRPTVAIFGPSERAIWGPRQENVSIVQAPGGQLQDLPLATVQAALAAHL